MIRHQVLPSSNRNNFLRANGNQQPQPPMQPQFQLNNNNLRVQPSGSRNLYAEPTNRRPAIDRNRNARSNNDEQQANRMNNGEDEAVNRLQRNLQLRSRRHENDDFNLPKRFSESTAPVHDRIAMAAFNQETPSTSSTSPRERRLQSLRRMEEKYQAMRQVNAPTDQSGDETSTPHKRIKRNCIGLFVCDISNILFNDDPYVEWIEHKNFGHINNAPERLILSSLVAGNGELIMFGGLRKESMSKSSDTTMQVSNAMHFLQVPREII